MRKSHVFLPAALLIAVLGRAQAQMMRLPPAAGQMGLAPAPAARGFHGLEAPPALLPAAGLELTPETAQAPSALPLPAGTAAATPAGAEAEPAKAQPAARASLDAIVQEAGGLQDQPLGAAKSLTGQRFDGGFSFHPAAFAEPQRARDPRIDSALGALSKSPIGLDLWRYAYDHHSDLWIKTDAAPGADYNARLAWEGGKPVIYLTESLLQRRSDEAAAAYLAREMSNLYYENFPVSAERAYLGYSNAVRVFAELSNSGLARFGYWWNTGHDIWVPGQNAYAMQRLYGSWREGVQGAQAGADARQYPFFQFLRGAGDSSSDPKSMQTLEEQRHQLGWAKYQQMNQYFLQIVDSERNWMSSTGRW